MSFVIQLEDNRGSLLERLDDPRGHLRLAWLAARRLGLLRLAELDPYSDYDFGGSSASDLVRDLDLLRNGLSQQILEDAKRELWEWWERLGVSGHPEEPGYRDYMKMADLK